MKYYMVIVFKGEEEGEYVVALDNKFKTWRGFNFVLRSVKGKEINPNHVIL